MSKVAISNPLTLIAIFAGLAETTAVSVLPFLEPTVQSTFVWFVMLFPALLVGLFFAVLWWRSQNLYAPTDYREDASYLHVHGTPRPAGSLVQTDEPVEEGPDSGRWGSASPTQTPTPTPAAKYATAPAVEHIDPAQSVYQLQSPAPTPKIAQTTLEFGEAVMAERLALEKLRALRGGNLTSPATVTVSGTPYQFDGVLAQGQAINIVEVIYKREREFSSKLKKQLEVFRKLKRQMDSDGRRQEVAFTIAVVAREVEDFLSIDSMVRSYATNFDLEISIEIFDLRSLMSELNN